jgi:5-methylcytosine-specific restriction endonuclease McrA
MQLLYSRPNRNGERKTHFIDDGRTYCGKPSEEWLGEYLDGELESVTCKGCLTSFETRQRDARRHYDDEERQRARQRAWWKDYNAYLLTPDWRARRLAVLRRANGTCEGCGQQAATQVHHLTYERIGCEMLFDLVALCDACHHALHPDREPLPSSVPHHYKRLFSNSYNAELVLANRNGGNGS